MTSTMTPTIQSANEFSPKLPSSSSSSALQTGLPALATSDRVTPIIEVRVEPKAKLPDGYRELDDVIAHAEAQPGGPERMARARQRLLQRLGGETRTLPALRLQAGLSQTQLAMVLGTTQAQIARYESKKQLPSAQHLVNLAAALGVSADRILQALEVTASIQAPR